MAECLWASNDDTFIPIKQTSGLLKRVLDAVVKSELKDSTNITETKSETSKPDGNIDSENEDK